MTSTRKNTIRKKAVKADDVSVPTFLWDNKILEKWPHWDDMKKEWVGWALNVMVLVAVLEKKGG